MSNKCVWTIYKKLPCGCLWEHTHTSCMTTTWNGEIPKDKVCHRCGKKIKVVKK